MPTNQRMSYLQGCDTRRDYVCNVCWGRLDFEHVKELSGIVEVHCVKDDCTGSAFVTQRYAERRINDSHFEELDAYNNLGEALGLKPTTTRSAEQSLKELGY